MITYDEAKRQANIAKHGLDLVSQRLFMLCWRQIFTLLMHKIFLK